MSGYIFLTVFIGIWVVGIAIGFSQKLSTTISIGGGFIIACIGLIVFSFISGGVKPHEFDYKYEKNENQYGVEFYHFRGKNPPIVDVLNAGKKLKDINQINKLLEIIKQPTIEPALFSSYKTAGKYLFVWDDYNGNELTIKLRENNYNDRKSQKYICIKEILISPDRRQMLINQAENSKNKEYISKDEYGTDWPFLVDEGILECRSWKKVVFTTFNGKTYAVNGSAMGTKEYIDIHEIWKKDYESENAKYFLKINRPDMVGYINIGPIINRGLELCQ
jgi:hypothetical protein